MTNKVSEVAQILIAEGFKEAGEKLRKCQFTENYQITYFVNTNCQLKVEQMDKVLKVLNK